MKRLFAVVLLLAMLPLLTGCVQALIVPIVGASAVVVDRQVCKKKGIAPAKVNPDGLAAAFELAPSGRRRQIAPQPGLFTSVCSGPIHRAQFAKTA